ncbi:MAG: glycosyltransferase family 4 protein [Verrucomicrobiae bacterium]|nr:glycosyltransferase family 4 protein [Verrucomicrobiae bacterium]
MKKNPVIYIHHERALGGAPLSLLYLLRQLDRSLYEPQVVCLREGPAAELYRKEGLPVRVIPGPDLSHTELVWFRWWQWPRLAWRLLASVSLYWRLRRHFAGMSGPREQVIVHLNSSTLAVAAMAAKAAGLKVVWHIREPLAAGYAGFRRRVLRRAVEWYSDAVVAISNHDASRLGERLQRKVTVVYNFVDFKQFDARLPHGGVRRELRIPPDAPVVLFLGGSSRVKGSEVLLRAAEFILTRVRTAHLIIAGESDPDFNLRAGSGALESLRPKIHVLGPRLDVPSLLADSNVLVFPSITPHFARPVIEAAAMARPVVASDIDGVRELVARNETGVLAAPGDFKDLADKVIDLLQDPPRAFRLGQQGLAMARERFDAGRNAAATFVLYAKLLSGPGGEG